MVGYRKGVWVTTQVSLKNICFELSSVSGSLLLIVANFCLHHTPIIISTWLKLFSSNFKPKRCEYASTSVWFCCSSWFLEHNVIFFFLVFCGRYLSYSFRRHKVSWVLRLRMSPPKCIYLVYAFGHQWILNSGLKSISLKILKILVLHWEKSLLVNIQNRKLKLFV